MLRAAVVLDYQNVHLTGAGLFAPGQPAHESLVHPLHFANQLLLTRNGRQRPGYPGAELAAVHVFRGLPSADHDPKSYGRNLAQQREWERDARVQVTLRPLKYDYQRTASGQVATTADGKPIVVGRREKGIDVLCALALVRYAHDPNIDLVILASQDTDLEPAIDEVLDLTNTAAETSSWYLPKVYSSREIRPARHRIWNTRLGPTEFERSRDRKDYV